MSRMILFVFQKTNDLYLTRPNKEQYERYLKQGLAGENYSPQSAFVNRVDARGGART
ncbi:hypothetical protein L2D08_12935 [Domibacillus sp. PGB-M46]|uniref:hypothetical protein n=1 Tax=Domibacillus sp. PGB-M46 TaxID=2910255 RepID=UPI001F584F3C|nr:hypothetical protein [Domibacillus sp. PGB-M46]MCI2255273.1 hypothetical protein [Domibacillus sp. PGB-M46]